MSDCPVGPVLLAPTGGGGLYNDTNGTGTLTGCVLRGNTAPSGGGVYSINLLTLIGCTLSGNAANAGQGGGLSSGGLARLSDDVLYGDTGGEVVPLPTGNPSPVTDCDVQGGINAYDAANHVLSVDPQFVSATDLHLQATSPVIAQGTSDAPGFRPTDRDGNPYGFPPALGAYEPPPTPADAHLLWDNPDGRMAFWSVDAEGRVVGVAGYGPYTEAGGALWHAVALATGPYGASYVLWDHPDGRAALWSLDANGGLLNVSGYGPYAETGGALWHATAASAGPDGQAHLLWDNPSGRVALWAVGADGSLSAVAGYGPFTDTGTGGGTWSAGAVSTGPDGVSHLLWNNPDARIALWDVTPDFRVTFAGYGPSTDDAGDAWAGTALSAGPGGAQHVLWGSTGGRAEFRSVAPDLSDTLLAGYGPLTDPGSGDLWSAKALATGADDTLRILWDTAAGRAMLYGLDGMGTVGLMTDYGPYTDTSQASATQNLWSAVAVSAAPAPVGP